MDIAPPPSDTSDAGRLAHLCEGLIAAALDRHAPRRVEDARGVLEPLLALLAAKPGDVWDTDAVFRTLRRLGSFDLSVGRLFEGHVNALQLVDAFGDDTQRQRAMAASRPGALFALWSADAPGAALALAADCRLKGGKVMCSGAGAVDAALLTASTPAGPVLVWMPSPERWRFDEAAPWPLSGMAATNSLGFDADGLAVRPGQILGAPGDYLAEPAFSGGIWRILALQLGALDRLQDALLGHVAARDQLGLPAQRRRIAENAIDGETAALWVRRAADAMDAPTDAAPALARVTLAREVVCGCAERISARVQRGMGLAVHQAGHPIGRMLADLDCLLRQPAPDLALDAAQDFLHRTRAAERWAP